MRKRRNKKSTLNQLEEKYGVLQETYALHHMIQKYIWYKESQ
jgi:hypothetical protein